jgi:SAM-dependent methyltransferase
MKQALKKLMEHAKSQRKASGFVHHAGFILPPRSLRWCGEEFKDDAYYLKSARLEAQRLERHAGLSKSSRVLDVGCGPGRLAIGILSELGELNYTGLDVSRAAIDWCRQHIEREHPSFRFLHVDIANERYNPDGRALDSQARLPLEDASVDVVNLYSVFSHMSYGDIVNYLAELRRVISPNGHAFLTAFVEEKVPNYSVNPPGYLESWSGALHCVRFQREFFDGMLEEAGFQVAGFEHGRETNGQSAFYLAPNG